ncbi:hypothetical protein [Streptomyces tanashiensis]|uniref:Uncharacterized protein n=1 Tax=Streptomyces tanashiensis TaxID=67367 RepID=A0ABY6R8C6_9ACTN|nr:hypothetical protein [Streptomyces tanashiensis]UZX26282.1 hypothetical protein LDH80_39045 [Streptomyces tanashiensis]
MLLLECPFTETTVTEATRYHVSVRCPWLEVDPRAELVLRPHAILSPGDEEADRNGRAWRFDAACHWHSFDGEQSGAPVWPLTLLFRHGEPTPREADEVARATVVCGHVDELERWSGPTRARPAVPQQ